MKLFQNLSSHSDNCHAEPAWNTLGSSCSRRVIVSVYLI